MQKYEVLGAVGEGAYGVVIKCRNKENNEIIAIKKFKDSDDDEIIRKNAQREIKALKFLKHENIVELKEAFKRKNRIHLVFEYVERSLLEVLEKSPHGLEAEYIKKIIYQLVKAINFCHSKDIVHRDIKPENLLVNKKSVLKLCDFGFARNLPLRNSKEIMTDYVATRWYRAPELLLSQSYGKPVDIWSIACIMAELIDGQPLFPGESETDQLTLIQRIIDPLTMEQREAFNRHSRFNMKFKEVKKTDTLDKRYLGKISKRGMAFIKAILKMDPKERLTSQQALEHPYFEDLRASEINEKLIQKAADMNKKPNFEAGANSGENGHKIREERANLDKQKRDDRKPEISNKENDIERKPSLLEEVVMAAPVKVPSFISETKLMHKSVYNYKLDDDKKLEEIFPYADQYTNKHENTKGLAFKHPKKESFMNANLKVKGMTNWIKNKNKKIQSIISNFNMMEPSNKATSYDSRLLNNEFLSDYVHLNNEYDFNLRKENHFLQNLTKQNVKSHLPTLHKTHGKSEEKTKLSQLGVTNIKFDMPDNFMKMKVPFSNSDINNAKIPLKTDGNNGKKLDDIKNIYNNTFSLATTFRGTNVLGNKEAKKKIK